MKIKNLSLSFLTIGMLLFNACSNGQSQNSKTNLSATEFADMVQANPAAPLLDVRTPEEFSKGHLVYAKNVDWNGSDFDKQTASLDKEKPVFVYCLAGSRSASAASKLRSQGFKTVYELNGGIMKWRGANLPETTDNLVRPLGMTVEQFNTQTTSDKIVLVDFYADWCGPCKKMKPYLDEISKDMADKVIVLRINADDNQNLCKSLKIDALPVLQVYKQGKQTWNNVGFIEKPAVLHALQ